MKPYDRINWKVVAKSIVVLLALCLVGFLVARPIIAISGWFSGMGDWLGYAFCNPTLWLLGLDDLMWGNPVGNMMTSGRGLGMILLCGISIVVHIVVIVFSFSGLSELWDYFDKK